MGEIDCLYALLVLYLLSSANLRPAPDKDTEPKEERNKEERVHLFSSAFLARMSLLAERETYKELELE